MGRAVGGAGEGRFRWSRGEEVWRHETHSEDMGSPVYRGGGGDTVSADTQWAVGNVASMFCCKRFESRNEFVLNGAPWKAFQDHYYRTKHQCVICLCDTQIGCSQPANHWYSGAVSQSVGWCLRGAEGSHQHQTQSTESPTSFENFF